MIRTFPPAQTLVSGWTTVDGVTHTLREHAIARGLPNVMIEVRNDLIDTPSGVNRITGLLAPMLAAVGARVPMISG